MDYIHLCPYDFEVLQLSTSPVSLSSSKLTPSDAPPACACTIAVIGTGTAYYRVDGGQPQANAGIPFTAAHGVRWIGDAIALKRFQAIGSGTVSLAVTYYR